MSARLQAQLADGDAKLAYYLEQHGDAKKYIAELEQYRDDLLQQLQDRKRAEAPVGRGMAARLRAAYRAFRDA